MSGCHRPGPQWLFEHSCLTKIGLQDAVFQHYPDGECEVVSVSESSPGRVLDDETLTRLIIHPIHYDPQQNLVSPMAFQDATTLDLSLFREGHATDDELKLAAGEIAETGKSREIPQVRGVSMIMQASAHAIRALTFDKTGKRMCFVYDTAEPTKPSHASVFTPPNARKGSGQREVRRKLLELFVKTQLAPADYARALT